MHRHLLVFIPPVITVPWHGDSTGGEGHSTEHGTTTARRAGGWGDIPSWLCSSPGRNKDRIPSQERDATAPGKGCCGLSSAPGRAFVPLWCQFRLQHPPSHRDRMAGPSRLAPSEGPSRARGWCSWQGWDAVSRVMGMGCREGGAPHPASSLRGKSKPPARSWEAEWERGGRATAWGHHCKVSHTARSVTLQGLSHPKGSHSPRSVTPQGQCGLGLVWGEGGFPSPSRI